MRGPGRMSLAPIPPAAHPTPHSTPPHPTPPHLKPSHPTPRAPPLPPQPPYAWLNGSVAVVLMFDTALTQLDVQDYYDSFSSRFTGALCAQVRCARCAFR